MKLIRLAFTLILFFKIIDASAQKLVDIVYLKNGRQYIGEIISYERGQFLILRQSDEKELVLMDSIISRVYMGADLPVPKSESPKRLPQKIKPRISGFYAQSMFALGPGSSNGLDVSVMAGIHALCGYQFNPGLSAGLGFGWDNYSPAETLLPLYGDLRGFLPLANPAARLYLGMSGGYGFALTNEDYNVTSAKGGVMMNPFAGLSKTTEYGMDMQLDLGLKFQKLSYERLLSEDYSERTEILFRRLTIRFGLTFWFKKD